MNRTLKTKRLWSMGQFNNVELASEINDIPEKIALNPKAIGLLYNLMILEMEATYNSYLEVYKNHPMLVKAFPAILDYFEEMNIAVQQEKVRTYDELMKELNTTGE